MAPNATTRYGNSVSLLLKTLIGGTALALALFWIAAPARDRASLMVQIGLCAAVGAIIPLVVLITMLSAIEIEENEIRHVLLGGWVLSRKSLSEARWLRTRPGVFPVMIGFEDGSTIRHVGFNPVEVARLREDLRRLCPYLKAN